MKTLTLKVFKDIKARKWQFLAVSFLVFLGISLFSGLYSSYLNIGSTYKKFYTQTDFEDIGATFNLAPITVLNKINSISGVKAVGRLTAYATMEINGREVHLKLVSIPKKNSIVDKVYIVKGKYPKNSGVLVLDKFAELNKLCIGQIIKIKVNGKIYSLRIYGTACSPEYVLITEGYFSTPKDFGIIFVPYPTMEKITGKYGKINEVHVKVYTNNINEILNKIKEILKPYGIKDIYKKENQPSYKLLKMDLHGFEETAIMFPGMLLIVATLSAYVLLSRTVTEQRGIIAVLRAMGYPKKDVIIHYLSYSILIGIVGTIPAIVAGYYISSVMTKSYIEYINVPYYVSNIYPSVMIISLIAGILTPAIAGGLTAKKAAEIDPAVAIRGVTTECKVINLDRFILKFSSITKMAIKNTFRNPKRSIYTFFGVAMAVVLIATSLALLDSTENMINTQFNKIQTFDYEVKTTNISAIKSLKDVKEAYPLIDTWIVFNRNDISKKSTLIGLTNQNLYRIYDINGKRYFPPPKGLIIPESLAKNLSISKGETVKVLTKIGEEHFKIYDIIPQPLTPVCYANLNELKKLGFKPNYVIVKGGNEFELKNFGPVISMKRAKKSVEEMMNMMYTFFLFSVFFGVSLSFAEIFNTTTANVFERRREIATLLMLGYSIREITSSILIETYMIGIPGIIAGFPIAKIILQIFKMTYKNDIFHMPFVMYPDTYIITTIIVAVTLLISLIPAINYISNMDIAEVTRETPE